VPRRGRPSSMDFDFIPELIPEPVEPAFVDHFVELLSVGVEFEARLTNLILLDFNIDSGQVAAQDEHADSIRHSLKVSYSFSGIGHT
jgi:hypothetical protein